MQENHLFEYAILRVVPKVERGECFNIGVVLYCRKPDFLQVRFELPETKARLFCDETAITELYQYLHSFEMICKGDMAGGAISRLDTASRFRWLTAARSTILQTSGVHPGLCHNPEEALSRLFTQLVL